VVGHPQAFDALLDEVEVIPPTGKKWPTTSSCRSN
jgi:hypothetical protein